jgi:hypothetical protein
VEFVGLGYGREQVVDSSVVLFFQIFLSAPTSRTETPSLMPQLNGMDPTGGL